MTFSAPEENTLGVVLTGAGRRARAARLARPGRSAYRASMGVAFLGLGALLIVVLRAVYGASWFVGLWLGGVYPRPLYAIIAWALLVITLVAIAITTRTVSDRLPDWAFALILVGLAVAVALDLVAVWDLHDPGRTATAAFAAGMALLALVTTRGSLEILVASGVLAVGLAVVVFLSAQPGDLTRADWLAPQITALASTVAAPVIGVVIVDAFRRMVQVELDRALTSSATTAPRFAVGMLASEELARLDLAAEELFDSIAQGKTELPLTPKMASVAASLATELRLHLIEGRRETWLYHAISESELLGKSVTLIDKSSLAGLLDPNQRDGLLSAAWLLITDPSKNQTPTVTVQIGPVIPNTTGRYQHTITVPITITTTGVPRNRVDPSIWDAVGRVGRYSDSTQESSLRVDIECVVDNPADH